MNQMVNGFTSIEQVTNQYLNKSKSSAPKTAGTAFSDILKNQLEVADKQSVKFSKHASMRLDDRNITLSAEQSERLEAATAKAGEKGIQDSLVLLDSMAFIVNVPSQTVVTAMNQDESLEKVFTNIDGAVIA
ncbi:MAG: flagellar protein [Lachnospiraceae bacterium]|nr:flagellar protein [Lachnospiraceae bacterium]